MTVPSVPNTAGTLAGLAALAASTPVVSAVAATAPFVYMAACTGVPAIIFATAVCGLGSMLINYGVTNWAEGKVVEQQFDKWWPMLKAVMSVKTYSAAANYPNPAEKNGSFPSAPVAQGPANGNFNKTG